MAAVAAVAVWATGCDRGGTPGAAPVASTAGGVETGAAASAPVGAPQASSARRQRRVAASPAPVEASVPAAPAVRAVNIGIHIGGGPNDEATKAPIATSVAPHLAEMAACWRLSDRPERGGDFGVDLLVPAQGGAASVGPPRTALGPEAFRECVSGVFRAIAFARPAGGKTKVSYAVRFVVSGDGGG